MLGTSACWDCAGRNSRRRRSATRSMPAMVFWKSIATAARHVNRRARHRSAAEDHADPRARAPHALPRLFEAARASLQAQLPGRAAHRQDFSERPAVGLVAGGTSTACMKFAGGFGNRWHGAWGPFALSCSIGAFKFYFSALAEKPLGKEQTQQAIDRAAATDAVDKLLADLVISHMTSSTQQLLKIVRVLRHDLGWAPN
jgi:hypothetical protein